MPGPGAAPSGAGERLVVALVRGVHGLRGAVRVEVLTDHPEERFAAGRQLFREGDDRPLTIGEAVPDRPGWLLRFREIRDRTAADQLRDAYLEARLEPAEGLPRGAYWWHEVLGATVRDQNGNDLGQVADIYRAGGAEVFVIRDGPRGPFDLPAVRAFIRVFAPRRGEIVVDAEALDLPPPGRRPTARGRLTRRRLGARDTVAGATSPSSTIDRASGPDEHVLAPGGNPELAETARPDTRAATATEGTGPSDPET